jgi:hypothetical protein
MTEFKQLWAGKFQSLSLKLAVLAENAGYLIRQKFTRHHCTFFHRLECKCRVSDDDSSKESIELNLTCLQ